MADENGREKRAVELGEASLDEVAGGAFYELGGDQAAYDTLPRAVGDTCPFCGKTRGDKYWNRWHIEGDCQFGPFVLCDKCDGGMFVR